MSEGDLTTRAEKEYLETVFWLEEAGLPMTAANVARAMQLSAPTVHEMVGRLVADGLILRRRDKSLKFTDEGRSQASELVRRHRLVERFLTDVLGIPWDDVHEEAERLEHAISPKLEARILASVGDATTCPHGHPISGAREPGVPLADVEPGASIRILRFENEAEELLHHFMAQGLHAGFKGSVERRDPDGVRVSGPSGFSAHVSASVAETVTVKADPSPPARTAQPPESLVLTSDRFGR
jgi:DtxR family transcriptional regulator, Mn-dependent transcriptional regulator